jgi:hypothetical protein
LATLAARGRAPARASGDQCCQMEFFFYVFPYVILRMEIRHTKSPYTVPYTPGKRVTKTEEGGEGHEIKHLSAANTCQEKKIKP